MHQVRATQKAKKAAAKARRRGLLHTQAKPADVAKLAQTAFVPLGGVDLMEAARPLRAAHGHPATLCAHLAAWRSSDEDRDACGDMQSKEAIECFVDSYFTVFTVDNLSYHPLPTRAVRLRGARASESERESSVRRAERSSVRRGERRCERRSERGSRSERRSERSSERSSESDGAEGAEAAEGAESESESESESEGAEGAPWEVPWRALTRDVPWLSPPSLEALASFAVVHQGPLAGGHLKLYLQACTHTDPSPTPTAPPTASDLRLCLQAEGFSEAEGSRALYQVDLMKEASKVAGHDWGAATPLARAAFAYPRSGSMYPTIFRFAPAAEGAQASIPAVAASASELRFSERGRVISGSGW